MQQQLLILNTILMVIDAVAVILAGYAAVFVKFYRTGGHYAIDNNIFVSSVLLLMFANNYILGRLGMYDDSRPRYKKIWLAMAKITLIDFAVLSTYLLIWKIDFSREVLLLFILFIFADLIIGRSLAYLYVSAIARQGFNVRRLLIVGNGERGQIVKEVMKQHLNWGVDIVGVVADGDSQLNTLGPIAQLPRIIDKHSIDEVIFAVGNKQDINVAAHLAYCREIGLRVRILPALWQQEDYRMATEQILGVPFLTFQSDNFNATGILYKRLLDIVGGLIGTVIFLAVFPVVALLLKLDSSGPILFKQRRGGQNGRIFQVYKFRTMVWDAERQKQKLMAANQMTGAMFKMADDPRITRVGRWLRRTSIDEVPQFVNVLRGEMSLVGTRPPTLDEIGAYQPAHRKRISIKPGITGLWQVSGRSKITDFEKVVELDCRYLENWRFSDDLKILLKTIAVVLQRNGAA